MSDIKFRSVVFCPFENELEYNTDIQLETYEEMQDYCKKTGIHEFAILDALSLEYLIYTDIYKEGDKEILTTYEKEKNK